MINENDNIKEDNSMVEEIENNEDLLNEKNITNDDENSEQEIEESSDNENMKDSFLLSDENSGSSNNEEKENKTTTSKMERDKIILIQYYSQYTKYIKKQLPEKAILSLSNIYLTIEKKPSLFFDCTKLFQKNKNLVHDKIALQGIGTLQPAIKLKVEVFYTFLKAAVYNEKIKIDFDRVMSIIQNKDLLLEYKKSFNFIHR